MKIEMTAHRNDGTWRNVDWPASFPLPRVGETVWITEMEEMVVTAVAYLPEDDEANVDLHQKEA